MNILQYSNVSKWKLYLSIIGFAIISFSLWYTTYLAKQLMQEEKNKVKLWSEALERSAQEAMNTNAECDLTLFSEIISSNRTIPILLVNEKGTIDDIRNLGIGEPGDTATQAEIQLFIQKNAKKLNAILIDIKQQGTPPIEIAGIGTNKQYIYYQHSKLLNQLQYYPYIQLIVISAFIILGYIGFSASRKSEQNRVWVGLAKETAHQLGTPISAIIAWIEHLKLQEPNEETSLVINELRSDVRKLELVADRFSKIGAEPELVPTNILFEVDLGRDYMQKRAPKKVVFDFPEKEASPMYSMLNSNLFEWVLENLFRNALDAMGGHGVLKATLYEEGNWNCIDISDTGKGIPTNKFQTVFKPGYSTKLRGWGLGLSLCKRIIEDYHKGKIFVKESEVGKGTTFTIKLKKIMA